MIVGKHGAEVKSRYSNTRQTYPLVQSRAFLQLLPQPPLPFLPGPVHDESHCDSQQCFSREKKQTDIKIILRTPHGPELGATLAKMGKKSERRHPLVARLTDGVLIYSRSFWLDFWLVYKNQHIVVSTFACHPAHFFTKTDRFWVCLASLFVAFGVSGWLVAGISENWAESRRDECTRGAGPWAGAPCFNASGAPLPRTDDGSCPQGALCDPQALRKADLRDIVILSALSCCLQVFYDYFSALFVTCGCVQNGCPAVVRACFEGLG